MAVTLNGRTTMKKIALVLIALLGVMTITTQSASAAPRPMLTPTNYTSCSQSQAFGNRICFDETTVFGPVVQIFSTGTTVYDTFPVNYDTIKYAGVCRSFVASAAEHTVINTYMTQVAMNFSPICSGQQNIFTLDSSLSAPSANAFTAYPTDHDLIEWFGNQAGFEFVWVD
jgi:hypothetical protein